MSENRNCGTCVHRFIAGMPRCAWAECADGHFAIILPGDAASCEHWQASDQHRIALALETLVEIQAMGAGLIDPPADDSRPQKIVCTCGSYFEVNSADLAATCPFCKQAYAGDGEGLWYPHPLDESEPG